MKILKEGLKLDGHSDGFGYEGGDGQGSGDRREYTCGYGSRYRYGGGYGTPFGNLSINETDGDGFSHGDEYDTEDHYETPSLL